VLADATTAAVYAPVSLPLVLAQAATAAEGRGLAGLLGCRGMWRQSIGLAQCIGWKRLFFLSVLSLWPCGPLPHSLLAHRGCLQNIHVIRNPTLRRILHVEAFCAVGALLPLLRGAPVFSFRSTVTLLLKPPPER